MKHKKPGGDARRASSIAGGPGGELPDGDRSRADDDMVGRSIFRFLRLMNAGDDDDALLDFAVSRNWLDPAGSPTNEGRRLVRGFQDVERARSGGPN